MKNTRTFEVSVEKVIRVTLDMDKYQGDLLQQYIEYNSYEHEDFEEVIKDTVEHLALEHVNNGYTDDAEGFIKEGHVTKHIDTYWNVEEK